jgi:biopolymer transport protein ExbD
MSGMTDIVFLLLIFFMLTSTLIAPNALKMLMPQSGQVSTTTNKVPVIELNARGDIKLDGNSISFENLEPLLLARLQGQEDPAINLIAERGANYRESVRIMNIAAQRNYKVVLKENQ